jgi:mycothiol system anti-sigma-R factor
MSVIDWFKRLLGSGVGSGPPGSNGKGEDAKAEMISCQEALSALYEYLDGELEGVTQERVKAHLDVCARCYPKLALEKSFLAAVKKAGGGEKAPPELKGKVLHLLKELEGS